MYKKGFKQFMPTYLKKKVFFFGLPYMECINIIIVWIFQNLLNY